MRRPRREPASSVRWTASSDNVARHRLSRLSRRRQPPATRKRHRPTPSPAACLRTELRDSGRRGRCGRHRSAKAAITAKTKPCKLAARIAGVGVTRTSKGRTLLVKLRVNRSTSARLKLTASAGGVAAGRYRVVPGTNTLRLNVPRTWAAGSCRLSVVLVNPDGGSLALPGRVYWCREPGDDACRSSTAQAPLQPTHDRSSLGGRRPRGRHRRTRLHLQARLEAAGGARRDEGHDQRHEGRPASHVQALPAAAAAAHLLEPLRRHT